MAIAAEPRTSSSARTADTAADRSGRRCFGTAHTVSIAFCTATPTAEPAVEGTRDADDHPATVPRSAAGLPDCSPITGLTDGRLEHLLLQIGWPARHAERGGQQQQQGNSDTKA